MTTPKHYELVLKNLSFRECWTLTRSWKALYLLIIKLFRIQVHVPGGITPIDSMSNLRRDETAVPANALDDLRAPIQEGIALGFGPPRYYEYRNPALGITTIIAALRHHSGAAVMRAFSTRGPGAQKVLCSFLSRDTEGTYSITTDRPAEFDPTPGVNVKRVINGSLADLWQAHQLFVHSGAIRRFNNDDEAEALGTDYEHYCFDDALARGRYAEVAAAEALQADRNRAWAEEAKASGVPDAETVAELKFPREKKRSWTRAALILVITCVLFVTLGAMQWSWEYALLLIPILLIHEFGHYLAMRLFRYRNLQIFFIPLFGAAVSGQSFNVPGWKKVIVSLMGPVPGIVLGTAAGLAGIAWDQPRLTHAALIALIINGLNLLPILPLDGGWVMHYLVFARHRFLDVTFRAVAAAALTFGGFFGGQIILGMLGVSMLSGLSSAWKKAKIAQSLRERHLP